MAKQFSQSYKQRQANFLRKQKQNAPKATVVKNTGGTTAGTSAVKKPPAAAPPFDPLAPSFTTPQGLDKAATAQATAQVQPALDENTSQGQTAAAASATRNKELQGWYSWGGDRLKDAFNRAQAAANNLIATRSAGTVDEQNSLAAALQGTADDTGKLATQLGADAPQSENSKILAAAMAGAQGANAGAFDTTTALTLGTGERVANNVVAGQEAGRKEADRFLAVQNQLGADRKGILARMPDLITSARNDLRSTEFQKAQTREQLSLARKQFGESKANRLFQQWLAEQKLGLESKDQTFQQWLAKQNLGVQKSTLTLQAQEFQHQKAIDWANVGINQTQAETALAQLKQDAKTAKGTANQEKAKLRAQQFQTGLQLLSGYMAPSSGEGPPGVNVLDKQGNQVLGADGKPMYKDATQNYQPRAYDQAMRILTGQAGMSRSDALRLLRASNNSDWRMHAATDQQRLKRRAQGKPAGSPYHTTINNNDPRAGGYVWKNGRWVKVKGP